MTLNERYELWARDPLPEWPTGHDRWQGHWNALCEYRKQVGGWFISAYHRSADWVEIANRAECEKPRGWILIVSLCNALHAEDVHRSRMK